MDREKVFDLLTLISIAAFGLFTAYVCFGILQSQAESELHKYSVSGAIAGALISWSVLASVYLQFRKSSDALRKLRETNDQLQQKLAQGDQLQELIKRNQELQQKLIRGAPCPEGFEIDVDERQRIVLARPSKWSARGGVIFDLEMRPSDEQDTFPGILKVHFTTIDEDSETQEELYRLYEETLTDSTYYESSICELVHLGGEPRSIKSLKNISRGYIKVTIRNNDLTGKEDLEWVRISKIEYDRQKNEAIKEPNKSDADDTTNEDGNDSEQAAYDLAIQQTSHNQSVTDSAPSTVSQRVIEAENKEVYLEVWFMTLVCYHPNLKKVFFFDFVDDTRDFTKSSELVNQILNSIRFLI
jgi:hypothetical protein